MRYVTVNDIIDDIEFELMQSVLPRDDIGQGILALKQYQNKLRSKVVAHATSTNRDAFTQLFRFNDMLITLLQELAEEIHALRRDLRQFAYAQMTKHVGAPSSKDDTLIPSDVPIEREVHEIRKAIRDDAIWIDLQARLVDLPIIGRLIGPLQIFFHRPGLFYTRLLADRQAPINRTFGNWILDLDEIQKRHNAQIAQLNARVADLESRLKTHPRGTGAPEDKNWH